GERLCGHPYPGRGDAAFQTWGRLEPGVGTPVHMGHRGRAGRMRAMEALSAVLPDAGGRPPVPAGAKGPPGTYNPYEGKRVQLTWLRYSTSQRRGARLSARPARHSDPVRPVRPAACR